MPRLRCGLAFDTPDTPDMQDVTDVVGLTVPVPATQEHLDVLALVATLFSNAGFRNAQRRCVQPAEVRARFPRWPQQPPQRRQCRDGH